MIIPISKINRLIRSGVVIYVLLILPSISIAQPAAPIVNIEILSINGQDHVSISWQEVTGAILYNIYSATEPHADNWGNPLDSVDEDIFTYTISVDNYPRRFFYVTALGAVPDWLVHVQGGTFEPIDDYIVTLSSFYISKYGVTQSEWTSVMGAIYNPNFNRGQSDNHPVYNVSWFDAIEYCNRLSISEGLTPAYSYGNWGTNPDSWPTGWKTDNENHTNISCDWNADGYRLPTEMEREFAARGGVPAQNVGSFDDDYAGSNDINLVAWYEVNSGSTTHPVGIKRRNELDTYDLSGNLWEWCWDIRDDYPTGVYIDPTGPTVGERRALRGGSWFTRSASCRVFSRNRNTATTSNDRYGFRVVRRIN